MTDSRNDGLPQILVFLLLMIVILGALVVGSGGSSPALTPTALPATVAPATATISEAVAEATPEATAATISEAVAEVTPEATADTLAEAVANVAEATTEATSEATAATAVEPRVFFVSPADHAIVPTTFTVEMGAEGLTVEPAGEIHAGAGHFHIMIDAPFIEPGEVVPNDETHLHFGKAQTSAELTLTPGEHVLRLQFANGAHIALGGDQYRAEITVTVQ